MALFAKDGNSFISAWNGNRNHLYRCIECRAQVKIRRGPNRIPHFYHLQTAPSCRLYSKSEEHLLLQLQLKKLLPEKEAEIEHPFPSINRVADVLWEKEKIVFEVQCSIILETEVRNRITEYTKCGYQIIWILDDRLYNKRTLRPAEKFLRSTQAYFASVNRRGSSEFYDQFEILGSRTRIKKGGRLKIDPSKICLFSQPPEYEKWPSQVIQRAEYSKKYFYGDILERALTAPRSIPHALVLHNWKDLETILKEHTKGKSLLIQVFETWIKYPYLRLLWYLVERAR